VTHFLGVPSLFSSSLHCNYISRRPKCRKYEKDTTTRLVNDTELQDFGSLYLDDLQKNSTLLIRNQKQTGKTETQSFKIQKSKPIIDEIDKVLAKHYGFTDEELDFIINYDIKYRMGIHQVK